MNTILQQAVSFRSTVPIFLTLSVAPHYLFAWSLWRAVSSILPRNVYEYVDDKLYDTYQTMVVFFFENYAGTEVSHVSLNGTSTSCCSSHSNADPLEKVH